jgi:hypothetical protein
VTGPHTEEQFEAAIEAGLLAAGWEQACPAATARTSGSMSTS